MICIKRVMQIVNLGNFSFSSHFLHLFFRKLQVSAKFKGYGKLNFNITQLQITCADLMFILAGVDVYKVFLTSTFFFGALVLKFWMLL